MQWVIKHLSILVLPFFIVACQNNHVKINPSKSDEWELVRHFKGHQNKYTERFQLKGTKALIKYKVESTKGWTHSNLDVFIGNGDEANWENPLVTVFNKSHAKGIQFFTRPKGSYFLYIKPLEAHYDLKVYQKKTVNQKSKSDGKKSHSSESGGGHH